MTIFQIYPEFRIFDLPDRVFLGYGHRHISGSVNCIKIIFRSFSSMVLEIRRIVKCL